MIKKARKNLFRDIGFTDSESANLQARARLMLLLEQEIKHLDMSQKEIAKRLGVQPPRISELLNGKLEKFSLDLLIVYLARLGKAIDFRLVKRAA